MSIILQALYIDMEKTEKIRARVGRRFYTAYDPIPISERHKELNPDYLIAPDNGHSTVAIATRMKRQGLPLPAKTYSVYRDAERKPDPASAPVPVPEPAPAPAE